MEKWFRADRGIRYREHPTRRHGKKKDRYYVIRYRPEKGKPKQEALGWGSKGWTLKKARARLSELEESRRLGDGPRTLEEKRQAEEARRKAEEEARRLAEKEGVTCQQFFTAVYLPERKGRRYGHDDAHYRLWLSPIIGKKPLRKVSTFDLERVKKRLLDAGRAPRTCESVLATFRQAWNRARRDGIVSGDAPSRGVKAPRFDNRRQRFLTHEEAGRLLDALRERDATLYRMTILALHTGLRASEIFGLTWGCIDTEQEMIHVMDTKSGRNRVAFMTANVKSMLDEMAAGEPQAPVFFQSDGSPFKGIPPLWRQIVESLGFNDGITDRRQRVVFHSCRHTFASWHAMNGTDMFVLKELLGHQVFAMTARYSHLSPGTLRAATKSLERAMATATTAKDKADGGEMVNAS